jgi:hypothetical protein
MMTKISTMDIRLATRLCQPAGCACAACPKMGNVERSKFIRNPACVTVDYLEHRQIEGKIYMPCPNLPALLALFMICRFCFSQTCKFTVED